MIVHGRLTTRSQPENRSLAGSDTPPLHRSLPLSPRSPSEPCRPSGGAPTGLPLERGYDRDYRY